MDCFSTWVCHKTFFTIIRIRGLRNTNLEQCFSTGRGFIPLGRQTLCFNIMIVINGSANCLLFCFVGRQRPYVENQWSRAGMHNSNLMRAKKVLPKHSRVRLVEFFPIFILFPSNIKPNMGKFGLCGPNWKLSRATIGPRAVCCACLI